MKQIELETDVYAFLSKEAARQNMSLSQLANVALRAARGNFSDMGVAYASASSERIEDLKRILGEGAVACMLAERKAM